MKLGIDDYLLKNNLTEETLLDALNKISFDTKEDSDIERLALIGRKKLREDFFQAFDRGDGDKLNDLVRDTEINTNFNVLSALMIIPKKFIENENFLSAFAEMALNTSYFSTLFKKSLGKGFSDYLTELRIEHVKEQLVATSEKIKIISSAEGFSDYQYFCKIFRRLTGLTPSQYREKFLR